MSTNFLVRAIKGEDLDAVCKVAREALPADVVTPALFARKVFLDQNFDERGVKVAEADGLVVGFIVSFVRRHKIEDMADDSDKCWITLFAVRPDFQGQGIGSALLNDIECWLRSEGKKTILVGPYTPNWWVPGVDVNAYPGTVGFLEKRGYTVSVRPLAMDSNLVAYRRPEWVKEKQISLEANGVRFSEFKPELAPALFDFMLKEFPGDWQRHIRGTSERILKGELPPLQIRIATDAGSVVGFAHYEGERFGPFGTAVSQRGRGVGAVLLCLTVEAMRDAGLHNAFFMWTDDRAAKLYAEAGFRESRRFALLKKDLTA